MMRCRAFPVVAKAALTVLLCLPVMAQTASDQPSAAPQNGKPVPPPIEPKPFAIDQAGQPTERTVEFRSADRMTENDRLLLADAQSSITEHAAFSGFDFDKTNWTFQQIMCPALPNHLFLQFMRNNGAGDVTVFSASIPRGGEGRVRIVPVLRRGYSLWSPAPINAMTISAFNHIRAEEARTDATQSGSHWVGNALCYAALAGASPQLVSPDATPAIGKPLPGLIAVMHVNVADKNQEVIRFADTAAQPRPMEWTMTFTKQGKLVKATHSPAPMWSVKPVPQTPTVAKTWSVPQ